MPLNTQNYISSDYGRFLYPNSGPQYQGLGFTTPASMSASMSNYYYPPPHYQSFQSTPSSTSTTKSASASLSSSSSLTSSSIYNTDNLGSQSGYEFISKPFFYQPIPLSTYNDLNNVNFNTHNQQVQMRIEKNREQKKLPQKNRKYKMKVAPMRFVSGPYDLNAPKKKYHFKDNQSDISPDFYKPSNPDANLSQFSKEDIIILKNILPNAEVHKWKYISNRLSKTKSKKLNTEYCINKFHQMYNLPFNPQNTPLNFNYIIKLKGEEPEIEGENLEGMVGSSLGYILSRDGWNLID